MASRTSPEWWNDCENCGWKVSDGDGLCENCGVRNSDRDFSHMVHESRDNSAYYAVVSEQNGWADERDALDVDMNVHRWRNEAALSACPFEWTSDHW